MRIVLDNLYCCTDCTLAAVNGDYPDDERRAREVEKGIAALGPHLVPDFDSNTGEGIKDFSWTACDCCGSPLGGGRHRFAVLGN